MSLPFVSPAQIRAARALLGWSQEDLAKRAGVSRGTVAALEKGAGAGRLKKKTENVTTELISKVRLALEGEQVEFLPQDGVRMRSSSIVIDDLEGANLRLLNDILTTAIKYRHRTKNNEILIYGLREEDAEVSVGDYLSNHIALLEQAGLREKILCLPDTERFVCPMAWYRRLPSSVSYDHFPPVHVYGNKLAIVQWRPTEVVTIVENKSIADAFRSMFLLIWDLQRELRI